MPPGRQICPAWVCPHNIRSNPNASAPDQTRLIEQDVNTRRSHAGHHFDRIVIAQHGIDRVCERFGKAVGPDRDPRSQGCWVKLASLMIR